MRAPDRVVILNDFGAVQGGAAYLATTLARGIRDMDLPVTFVAGDHGAELGQGVDVVALGGTPLTDGPRAAVLRGLYDPAPRRRIGDWIARNDTPRTIYHLHNWSLIFSPAVFDALAPVARRTVVHAHDFFLACPNGSYIDYPRAAPCERRPLSGSCLATQCDKRNYGHKLWRAARQRVLWSRLGPFLRDARFVLIHEAMRPWVERAIRPRHLQAIPNPVEPFGTPVGAPEANRRIACIGAAQRLKGVFEVAEAGRRLGLGVDFFGAGEHLGELRARYPEHAYHGWTAREAIGRALGRARAAVAATQGPEPFCLAAFEAVATGLPLVVSDAILATGELVGSGAALPFGAGSAASLVDVLGRVARDDALVARLAGAARARGPTLSASQPDWVAAHHDLYCDLMEKGPQAHDERRAQPHAIQEPVQEPV